jgi:hypothetical protein
MEADDCEGRLPPLFCGRAWYLELSTWSSFARKGDACESAFSGRLKIAQRFIAGIGRPPEVNSVKRTAELQNPER